MTEDPILNAINQELKLFDDHVLTLLCQSEDGHSRVYQCAKPGTLVRSFSVSFGPHGIAIMGDYCPCRNGACSERKSFNWFASQMKYDYLASKFLQRTWNPRKALESFEELIHEGQIPKEELENVSEFVFDEEDDFWRVIAKYGIALDDERGWWYHDNDVIVLATIQAVFARLAGDKA